MSDRAANASMTGSSAAHPAGPGQAGHRPGQRVDRQRQQQPAGVGPRAERARSRGVPAGQQISGTRISAAISQDGAPPQQQRPSTATSRHQLPRPAGRPARRPAQVAANRQAVAHQPGRGGVSGQHRPLAEHQSFGQHRRPEVGQAGRDPGQHRTGRQPARADPGGQQQRCQDQLLQQLTADQAARRRHQRVARHRPRRLAAQAEDGGGPRQPWQEDHVVAQHVARRQQRRQDGQAAEHGQRLRQPAGQPGGRPAARCDPADVHGEKR